jgi:hypothetical protein
VADSERVSDEDAVLVESWLRLADQAVGHRTEEGACDECGEVGYLSRDGSRRVCARCSLELGRRTR